MNNVKGKLFTEFNATARSHNHNFKRVKKALAISQRKSTRLVGNTLYVKGSGGKDYEVTRSKCDCVDFQMHMKSIDGVQPVRIWDCCHRIARRWLDKILF
jgi:hypothetical protein